MSAEYEYDVALSFAGEDRDYVDRVAHALQARGIHVFYDRFEEAALWGKDLYLHFREIYQKKARFTVLFASEHYALKAWPSHERASAQARALSEGSEYILPARFDSVEIPGLLPTTAFIDLRQKTPEELAELVCQKLVLAGASLAPTPFPSTTTTSDSSPGGSQSALTVQVHDSTSLPIAGANLLLVAKNGTYLAGSTDAEGTALITPPQRRAVTIFCAHPRHAAHIEHEHDTGRDLSVVLPSAQGVGSAIFSQGTGYIPGLPGRLNPIRDTLDRLYLYADNIAINGGTPQPVAFALGEVLNLEDASSQIAQVRVMEIIGHSSVLEFRLL